MEWLFVVIPFVVLGIGVIFVAFYGGPGGAREAYLTRGGKIFTIAIVVVYLGFGIAIPAAVIANRGDALGGVGSLRGEPMTHAEAEGKTLFIENCKSCHTLAAVDAHGVTGPDLDDLGGIDKQRVINAIKNGGTGQDRMPAGLLTGEDADDVAIYVSKVAGQ